MLAQPRYLDLGTKYHFSINNNKGLGGRGERREGKGRVLVNANEFRGLVELSASGVVSNVKGGPAVRITVELTRCSEKVQFFRRICVVNVSS